MVPLGERTISGAVSTVRLEDFPNALSPNITPCRFLRGNVSGVNVECRIHWGLHGFLVRGQNSIKEITIR